MGYFIDVQGHCPACGQDDLHVLSDVGIVHCLNPMCPDDGAATKILADPEIHHVVQFHADLTFNVKHPLRERIGDKLLTCLIHTEVQRMYADGGATEGTWRLKHRDDVDGEEFNEWPWIWEKLS